MTHSKEKLTETVYEEEETSDLLGKASIIILNILRVQRIHGQRANGNQKDNAQQIETIGKEIQISSKGNKEKNSGAEKYNN